MRSDETMPARRAEGGLPGALFSTPRTARMLRATAVREGFEAPGGEMQVVRDLQLRQSRKRKSIEIIHRDGIFDHDLSRAFVVFLDLIISEDGARLRIDELP